MCVCVYKYVPKGTLVEVVGDVKVLVGDELLVRALQCSVTWEGEQEMANVSVNVNWYV